jgi:ADP-dependent phosphofructokinase/glucokinase
MQSEWAKLSARGDMIHAEFAHFSSLDFFQLFEKHAVMHADSLGMNEQELFLLLDFWEGKLEVISYILTKLRTSWKLTTPGQR